MPAGRRSLTRLGDPTIVRFFNPHLRPNHHVQRSDAAPAAGLQARRYQLRARRRRLSVRSRRATLSRLRQRHRGHAARPRPSAPGGGAQAAGREALALLQPLRHRAAAAARRAPGRALVRRHRVLLQLRRRGAGVRDQDGAPVPLSSAASPSATASSPSRAPSTAAPWRPSRPAARTSTWRVSGPALPGFDQVPFGELAAVEAAIGEQTAADPDRADPGRGRHPHRRDRDSSRSCARLCDEHDLLLIFDEVQCGHGPDRPAVRLRVDQDHAGHHGARQGAGRRLPDRRLPGHRARRVRHDARHARLDLRRQSARLRGRQRACSTCCSRSGFLEHVREIAERLRARLEQLAARVPGVILEVRGQGLLLGLRCGRPTPRSAPELLARGLLDRAGRRERACACCRR